MSSSAKLEKTQFLLEDEIKYTIEGLTVNLNAVTSVKFGHDDCLPDAVQGDRQTLRLALVTLIEFGMKYCNSGLISLKTKHEGIDPQDRNITKFGFSLTLCVNSNFDEKVIFALINK